MVRALTRVERDTQVPAHSMNFCITSNKRFQGERHWQQSYRLSEGISWQAGTLRAHLDPP